MDTRFWDRQYDKWLEDTENYPKPGPHPMKDHWWNTKPEVHNFAYNEENDLH